MFTIETIDWDKIKYQYEKWRLYDVTGPVHVLKIDKALIDIGDILSPCGWEKTIAFFKDKEALACMKIKDFSTFCSYPKIAGIGNFATNQAYRNNGIGRKMMEVTDFYLKSRGYDLSILYSSQYASQYGFYEKFGYIKHGDVHLKYYKSIDNSVEDLDQIIKTIGKF